jgi:hypothetical protein
MASDWEITVNGAGALVHSSAQRTKVRAEEYAQQISHRVQDRTLFARDPEHTAGCGAMPLRTRVAKRIIGIPQPDTADRACGVAGQEGSG